AQPHSLQGGAAREGQAAAAAEARRLPGSRVPVQVRGRSLLNRETGSAAALEKPGGSRWKRWLPGLQVLGRYEAAWLPHDLMAGLVLTTMLVPVGIAYAVASGVPGIYGLYATIVPLLAY